MKNYKKQTTQACCALLTLFASVSVSSVSASTISGGAMTLNIDRTALAAAFTHDNSDRPSAYVEEYFDSSQVASRTSSEILTDHIIPGTGEISGIGRQFTVKGSSTTGLNVANTFTFDGNDLPGTAANAIGLGGALRYRLDLPFLISDTGEETGNRVVNAYLSLEYDANRVDATAGHSGWAIFNHHSFRADVFDLDNVVTNLTSNSLTLSGDLALASGFDHLGGQNGAIVGDFNFQTTVVPVPAAVWLFVSGLAGLFVSSHAKRKSIS